MHSNIETFIKEKTELQVPKPLFKEINLSDKSNLYSESISNKNNIKITSSTQHKHVIIYSKKSFYHQCSNNNNIFSIVSDIMESTITIYSV